MSFDSAHQYKQVVSGDWNTISPIIMVLLWSIANQIIEGPGGLFLFFYLLFWLGLIIFTYNLRFNFWIKTLVIIAISMWPYNMMILPHLWKDIGLISFLIFAIGFIKLHLKTEKKYPIWIALVTLMIASMFRFESIVYISILQFYTILLILRSYQKQHNIILKTIGCVILVFVISILLSKTVIKLTGTKKVILWQTIALWDLSRVSVKVDRVLLPEFTIGEAMTVDELSTTTVPWTNTHLFSKTKSGINAGLLTPYKQEQYSILFKKWLSMMATYPIEYLTHRLEVTRELLRINESSNKPIDLYYSRMMYDFKDKFELNKSPLNKKITHGINSLLGNLVFKGWVYFVFLILVFILFSMTKRSRQSEFIKAISLSGISSVVILSFVSPSAEQRYLIWLFNSSIFILPLLLEKALYKQN